MANQPDNFAELFFNKIKQIVDEFNVGQNVYNGTKKINPEKENFMTPDNVFNAGSLKTKNCEGWPSRGGWVG